MYFWKMLLLLTDSPVLDFQPAFIRVGQLLSDAHAVSAFHPAVIVDVIGQTFAVKGGGDVAIDGIHKVLLHRDNCNAKKENHDGVDIVESVCEIVNANVVDDIEFRKVIHEILGHHCWRCSERDRLPQKCRKRDKIVNTKLQAK